MKIIKKACLWLLVVALCVTTFFPAYSVKAEEAEPVAVVNNELFVADFSSISGYESVVSGELSSTSGDGKSMLTSSDGAGFDFCHVKRANVTFNGDYVAFVGNNSSQDAMVRLCKKFNKNEIDKLTLEMKVKTSGDVKAALGISLKDEDANEERYGYYGDAVDDWKEVKVECSISGQYVSYVSYEKNDGVYQQVGESSYTMTGDGTTINLLILVKNLSPQEEVCFDDIKVYYTETYATLQEAIEAADATIDNNPDATVEIDLQAGITASADIEIKSGVTLDLNGNTLDMGDNYLLSNGNVVDSSENKAGRLKIATTIVEVEVEDETQSVVKPNGKLAENNSQMPVYVAEEGYMLANMTAQALEPVIETDCFTSVSRPSFGAAHVDKLQSGASAAKLQFILRLDWTKDENDYYQEFSYSDDLVKEVYMDGKAFSVTVNGLTDYASSMKVSEYVKSDLGVVLKNSSFSMVEASGE